MITSELARGLRDAGLRWHPATGDRFVIDKPGVDDDLYTLAEMTIERHDFPTGSVLGFNGTTEWALDSVAAEDALWLPREDQMRHLLGRAFAALTRSGGAEDTSVWTVTVRIAETERGFADADPATAYAQALLHYIRASLAV